MLEENGAGLLVIYPIEDHPCPGSKDRVPLLRSVALTSLRHLTILKELGKDRSAGEMDLLLGHPTASQSWVGLHFRISTGGLSRCMSPATTCEAASEGVTETQLTILAGKCMSE